MFSELEIQNNPLEVRVSQFLISFSTKLTSGIEFFTGHSFGTLRKGVWRLLVIIVFDDFSDLFLKVRRVVFLVHLV
jgi:hypothetical protein